jgi:hypothetical protein
MVFSTPEATIKNLYHADRNDIPVRCVSRHFYFTIESLCCYALKSLDSDLYYSLVIKTIKKITCVLRCCYFKDCIIRVIVSRKNGMSVTIRDPIIWLIVSKIVESVTNSDLSLQTITRFGLGLGLI